MLTRRLRDFLFKQMFDKGASLALEIDGEAVVAAVYALFVSTFVYHELSLKQLHERLAVIDAAQKNIAALSSEMLSLKDILSNKQARGAYGQARMEAIIRDGLPSTAYAFQGSLSNNTRPDCLVSLPDSDIRLVIDAKFPLEAFNALKVARGENELRNAEAPVEVPVVVAPAVLPPVAPAAKPAKERKIQANREERNGVKRPSEGTICAQIWGHCDKVLAETGAHIAAKDLRAALPALDDTTKTVQYYRWRKFNGIGR